MNKLVKKLIACFMIAALMVCGPFANVPKNAFAAGEDTASGTAAEEASEDITEEADKTKDDTEEEKDAEEAKETETPEESGDSKLYISELKLGEGITEAEAQNALTDEGYFILEKDGKPVDLNKDAASHNVLYKMPKDVYVYLGFKTTTDPNEAITDMAVMNMKGGYNFDDYTKLIEHNMETKIKPFMDKFVDTIREYRKNYEKPKKSANHIRADMVRQLLNRYTDDDTDGSPIGDLLLNETKYEMGDDAYNALSDSEKKKHADIITMLMQGNLTNISMIEKYLVRAADASDDTWIDRFENTSLDKLREDVENENPNATKSDIDKILDKKYNDAAKEILVSWDDYAEIAKNYEDRKDEIIAESEELEEKLDELDKAKDIGKMDKEEQKDIARDIVEINAEMLEQGQDIIAVGVSAQVEEKETDDMNMREFFSQPAENFRGRKIRDLYPMIASLSKGQIAGIQFMTIPDLLDAGFNNVAKLKDNVENIEAIPVTSVFSGVNRELFEPGAVALTNDALRQKAVGKSDEEFDIRGPIAAGTGLLALGSAIAATALLIKANRIQEIIMRGVYDTEGIASEGAKIINLEDSFESVADDLVEEGRVVDEQVAKSGQYASATTKKLRIVAGVLYGLMAVLIGVSLYYTFKSFYDKYHIDFTPIPKYMVDEADITTINDKGEKEFIRNDTAYYRVVECNRRSMNKGEYTEYYDKRIRELGDYGDLNGSSGKEWLALYTVKYQNAAPILADSLLVKTGADSSTPPDDYKLAIHMFGEKSAYDLNNKKLIYRDNDVEEIRVYFKQDMEVRKAASADGKDAKLSETGSLATNRFAVLYLVIGFAAGGLVAWIVMFIMGRRKKDATVE